MATIPPDVRKRLGLVAGYAFKDDCCVHTHEAAVATERKQHLLTTYMDRVLRPSPIVLMVTYLAGVATLVKAFIQACDQMRHAL